MNDSAVEAELLDSLRAGLRVEEIDFKDASTPKLIEQENAYWQSLVDCLEDNVNRNRSLGNRLRICRRQVLSSKCGRRAPAGLPHLALSAAAGVAILVAAGAWWYPRAVDTGTSISRLAPAHAVDVASMEPGDLVHAEFTDNIDFYSWLAQQSDMIANTGGG